MLEGLELLRSITQTMSLTFSVADSPSSLSREMKLYPVRLLLPEMPGNIPNEATTQSSAIVQARQCAGSDSHVAGGP
jgi:hypothetical protein